MIASTPASIPTSRMATKSVAHTAINNASTSTTEQTSTRFRSMKVPFEQSSTSVSLSTPTVSSSTSAVSSASTSAPHPTASTTQSAVSLPFTSLAESSAITSASTQHHTTAKPSTLKLTSNKPTTTTGSELTTQGTLEISTSSSSTIGETTETEALEATTPLSSTDHITTAVLTQSKASSPFTTVLITRETSALVATLPKHFHSTLPGTTSLYENTSVEHTTVDITTEKTSEATTASSSFDATTKNKNMQYSSSPEWETSLSTTGSDSTAMTSTLTISTSTTSTSATSTTSTTSPMLSTQSSGRITSTSEVITASPAYVATSQKTASSVIPTTPNPTVSTIHTTEKGTTLPSTATTVLTASTTQATTMNDVLDVMLMTTSYFSTFTTPTETTILTTTTYYSSAALTHKSVTSYMFLESSSISHTTEQLLAETTDASTQNVPMKTTHPAKLSSIRQEQSTKETQSMVNTATTVQLTSPDQTNECTELCANGGTCVITEALPTCACPKNATGPNCNIQLPKGTVVVGLGSNAVGNQWAFNPASMTGLGNTSPYINGSVAMAFLPDGSTAYVAIDPTSSNQPDAIFCKKAVESNQLCSSSDWNVYDEFCYKIQQGNKRCTDGVQPPVTDPIFTDPTMLGSIKDSSSCDIIQCEHNGTCVDTHISKICSCGTRATGSKCEIHLPNGTNFMKLGTKADGNKWPFDPDDFPGLAKESPYPDAEVAAAIFPDGSVAYLPLDPEAPAESETFSTLCKQELNRKGFCPNQWLQKDGVCYVLQNTGPDGICLEGQAVEALDPIMNDPALLIDISNSGAIDIEQPTKSAPVLLDEDPNDCWGTCSVLCGVGLRKNLKNKPECSVLLDHQRCQARPCPIDCNYIWNPWGMCSSTCGGGIQWRTPIVKRKSAHGGKNCPGPQQKSCNTETCPPEPTNLSPTTLITTTTNPTSTTTTYFTTTPVFPLDEVKEVVVDVMQTLGCSFILGSLGVTLGVFLLLRDFSHERCLHMNMEIALLTAHILILTMRDKTEWPVACKLTSIALQFFFLTSFAFMTLEALQAYSVSTNVISSGGFFTRLQAFLIGWVGSAAITGTSTVLKHKEFTSFWSCWTNLGSSVAMATVVPIGCLAGATVVMSEAAGMGDYSALPGTNRDQLTAAIANTKGLMVILPISVGSWFAGLFAVYYANLAMFSIVSALNMALGISIVAFHTLGNPKVHTIFKRWLHIICRK